VEASHTGRWLRTVLPGDAAPAPVAKPPARRARSKAS
jgi:hypothetical protein